MAVTSVPEIAVPAVTDDALLLRLRQGDATAGAALAQRYCEPLMRYLQRLTGPEAAEELHQQTWLSALDHIDKFDPAHSGGGFRAWLFRIATNKAKDHWRSKGRQRTAMQGLRLVTDTLVPPAEARLEVTELTERIRQAIPMLSESQRQVLMLRYYSKLPYAQIAEILGCPLNTALGRMHKAVLKLKELMDKEGLLP